MLYCDKEILIDIMIKDKGACWLRLSFIWNAKSDKRLNFQVLFYDVFRFIILRLWVKGHME